MIAEGKPGMLNPHIPAAISRKWLKRAETLQAKAESLLSDMLAIVGADDPLTDEADNIVIAAGEIQSLLLRGRALATRP